MSEGKRFRGLHYHFDGTKYHIWIYNREKDLKAMIVVDLETGKVTVPVRELITIE